MLIARSAYASRRSLGMLGSDSSLTKACKEQQHVAHTVYCTAMQLTALLLVTAQLSAALLIPVLHSHLQQCQHACSKGAPVPHVRYASNTNQGLLLSMCHRSCC